jgi:ubiquinone/menaquinone biosynthesis C-methylase UbiE
MLEKSLRILQCPRCKRSFSVKSVVTYSAYPQHSPSDVNILFGSVVCSCREYPVVQGILYLGEKKRKIALKLIHTSQFSKSVDALIDFPRGVNKLVKWVKPWGRIDRFLWFFNRSTENLFFHPQWLLILMYILGGFQRWMIYLLNRNSNPTFAHSLVSVSLISKGYIVDIASGLGHFISEVKKHADQGKVFAVDNSFWNLYISAINNKEVNHIYVDVEKGLPFQNNSVSFVSLNDCFHCFSNQKKISHEVTRIVNGKACIACCHVHNIARQKYFNGTPIPFPIFRKLFSKFHAYALSEKELHQQIIIQNKKIPLSNYFVSTTKKLDQDLKNCISYVAYFFTHKQSQKKLHLLPTAKKKINKAGFNYSEDSWLIDL